MGLVQNAIEAAGISTISLTVQPHITKMVGAPRAIYMRFPQGKLFGPPFDAHQQRSVLRSALEAVARIDHPGTILEYPGRWHAPRSTAKEAMPASSDADLQQLADSFENMVETLQRYRAQLIARSERYQAEGRDPESYRPISSNLKRIERLQRLLDGEVYDHVRIVLDGTGVLSNVETEKWI